MFAGESDFFEFGGAARDKLPAHNFFIVCGEGKADCAQRMSFPFILLTQPMSTLVLKLLKFLRCPNP
jgi:hypothetical protein